MWLPRLFDRVSRLQVFVLLARTHSEQSPLFALALSKVNIVTTLRLLVGVKCIGDQRHTKLCEHTNSKEKLIPNLLTLAISIEQGCHHGPGTGP